MRRLPPLPSSPPPSLALDRPFIYHAKAYTHTRVHVSNRGLNSRENIVSFTIPLILFLFLSVTIYKGATTLSSLGIRDEASYRKDRGRTSFRVHVDEPGEDDVRSTFTRLRLLDAMKVDKTLHHLRRKPRRRRSENVERAK